MNHAHWPKRTAERGDHAGCLGFLAICYTSPSCSHSLSLSSRHLLAVPTPLGRHLRDIPDVGQESLSAGIRTLKIVSPLSHSRTNARATVRCLIAHQRPRRSITIRPSFFPLPSLTIAITPVLFRNGLRSTPHTRLSIEQYISCLSTPDAGSCLRGGRHTLTRPHSRVVCFWRVVCFLESSVERRDARLLSPSGSKVTSDDSRKKEKVAAVEPTGNVLSAAPVELFLLRPSEHARTLANRPSCGANVSHLLPAEQRTWRSR